jgi:hypothetical protein
METLYLHAVASVKLTHAMLNRRRQMQRNWPALFHLYEAQDRQEWSIRLEGGWQLLVQG